MRCDSAAMVWNTSELLPEPETPVNTVSRRFGMAMLTSLRLFSRAPCTRMKSCASGIRKRSLRSEWATSAAGLDEADQVTGWIAEGTFASAVGHVHRLLDHVGAGRLHAVEGSVEVRG